MEMLLYLVPVFGILGLLFAAYLAARVGRQDAGNDRMKEIAAAISDGAQAFLTAEYKILVISLRYYSYLSDSESVTGLLLYAL